MTESRLLQKSRIRFLMVGSGSWATAIMKILLGNGQKAHWWIRNPETVDYMLEYGHNPKYLSSVEFELKPNQVGHNLKQLVRSKDAIIIAVPSSYVLDALSTLSPRDFKNKLVISAVKGMIPGKNQTVLEYVQDEFSVPKENCLAITGPCHAEEVAAEKLSFLTFSSVDIKKAELVASAFRNRFIKTGVIDDISGVEYSAVLKNIYALLSGICHGLGHGDNFQAILVSNAMLEMSAFLDTVFPKERKLASPAYLGDLLVTAYSQFSRNRTFGNMLGRGYSVKSAQMEMSMVAEGYYAVKPIYELSIQHQVDLPQVKATYHILHERIAPSLEISLLRNQLLAT